MKTYYERVTEYKESGGNSPLSLYSIHLNIIPHGLPSKLCKIQFHGNLA